MAQEVSQLEPSLFQGPEWPQEVSQLEPSVSQGPEWELSRGVKLTRQKSTRFVCGVSTPAGRILPLTSQPSGLS